jgi:dTDP-4-dehydrorhamnose 3,5-epimerase
MRTESLAIPEVLLITPSRFTDTRGVFVETWNAERCIASGIVSPFVQDNHSLSVRSGTVRGLHLQTEPNGQGKLVRCVRGTIWDVAVDVRPGSPTFGKHVAAELSAANWRQLWIPCGFLHGFCTLEPNTEVAYKVTASYNRDAERGVVWNDPQLALPWPIPLGQAVLSEKDANLPPLANYGAGLVFPSSDKLGRLGLRSSEASGLSLG